MVEIFLLNQSVSVSNFISVLSIFKSPASGFVSFASGNFSIAKLYVSIGTTTPVESRRSSSVSTLRRFISALVIHM